MNTTLFKRIRNKRGNPRGVLIAKPINETTVSIGWSLCSSNDKFDLEMGKRMAEGRTASFNASKVPHSIHADFNTFAKRCEHYFKGQQVIGVTLFDKTAINTAPTTAVYLNEHLFEKNLSKKTH